MHVGVLMAMKRRKMDSSNHDVKDDNDDKSNNLPNVYWIYLERDVDKKIEFGHLNLTQFPNLNNSLKNLDLLSRNPFEVIGRLVPTDLQLDAENYVILQVEKDQDSQMYKETLLPIDWSQWVINQPLEEVSQQNSTYLSHKHISFIYHEYVQAYYLPETSRWWVILYVCNAETKQAFDQTKNLLYTTWEESNRRKINNL
jgi:hypothetical protein